jgi:hypothetical protein
MIITSNCKHKVCKAEHATVWCRRMTSLHQVGEPAHRCGHWRNPPLSLPVKKTRTQHRNKDVEISLHFTIRTNDELLYGCETCSLILSEENRLLAVENWITRRIFGPKRDDNGDWKRFHNEEILSLWFSPNRVRVIKSVRLRWTVRVA